MHLGFDIGGTKIAGGIVDESGSILERASMPFPKETPQMLIDCLESMTGHLLEKAGLEFQVLSSVGAAVPGQLDPAHASVRHAYNLNLFDFPLKKLLQERLDGLPVFLANDADAATLAEWQAGALQGCGTGVLLTLGTGLGGGLILNGALFQGGLSHGTEPGHMTLALGREVCTCGNSGCAETLCAASWFHRCGFENAKAAEEAAKRGDADALAAFEQYTDALSSQIASIANLLDPERIALGGGLSQAGDVLYAPLRMKVKEKSFFRYAYPIVPASMGNDAGIVGAALLSRYL